MSGGQVRILIMVVDLVTNPFALIRESRPFGASLSTRAEAVTHSTIGTKYSHSMSDRVLWSGGHGALLLLVIAGIAFISGYWAILLALGPGTYLLVLDAHSSDNAPTNVAICYGTALVIGWVAYMAIAQGITPTSIEPMSDLGIRLVGSSMVAFAGATGVFYVLHTHQPMAFVAVFTTAIGALPTIESLVVAVIAALLMAGIQAVRRRYGPEFAATSDPINDQSFET